jgi:hypothetical protein
MPQIVSPDAAERRPLDQLPKDSVAALAREQSTQLRPGIVEAATEQSQQRQSMARERLA